MDQIQSFLPLLLRGAQITALIWVLALGLSIVFAFIGGVGRLSQRRWVRGLAAVYVEFFRGTSMVVQLWWMFFALPILTGISMSAVTAGVITLAMNTGAYGSEAVRGAIVAVDKGQSEAATALNFTRTQRLRRVILPQAVPMMLPPFGNLMIEMLKHTALVSTITVADLLFQAQVIRQGTGLTVEVFTTILVMYFVMAQVIALGTRLLEKRAAIGPARRTARKPRTAVPQ